MIHKLPARVQALEKAIIEALMMPLCCKTRTLVMPLDFNGKEVFIGKPERDYPIDFVSSKAPKMSLNDQCDKLNKIEQDAFKTSNENSSNTRTKSVSSSSRISAQDPKYLNPGHLGQMNIKAKQPPVDEIERLKGYKYERKYLFNEKTMRTNTVLICKYDGCNKVCNKTWDLLDHMRKHTGEKPYQCKVCLKRFSQRGNVIKHKKMHEKGAKKNRRRKRKANNY
ncbi:unnamed protein product [Moneuplotes crassus]|uniref:C2H2-type domain-containing protein n=1 Tax=Euplotes crassus TaxID=5936 RepID=A0AAD1X5A6_EUPCR|nr:unnamed protein product [Moneuplotes crassus]